MHYYNNICRHFLKGLPLLAFTIILFSCSATDYKEELISAKEYQAALTAFYEDTSTTPLEADERADFKGITFFPINNAFITEADLQKKENGQTLAIPTSSGKRKNFIEYGMLYFRLKGKECKLAVYQSDPPIKGYESELFLPFRDLTNGKTTYGNGRYLDVQLKDIKDNKILLDFNRAYNPYCAYSHHYNCPITPYTNSLNLAVEAGVSLSDK